MLILERERGGGGGGGVQTFQFSSRVHVRIGVSVFSEPYIESEAYISAVL